MNVLSLPLKTVIEDGIPYLEWNDLLNFRHVCKEAKKIVHGYLKQHPDQAPEIEITDNEGPRSFTLEQFVKMGISCSKLFFRNVPGQSGYYYVATKTLDRFLEERGPEVCHVRVCRLTFRGHGKERKFWDCLVNLKSVQADGISSDRDHKTGMAPAVIPTVFRKLKSLNIGSLTDFRNYVVEPLEELLEACEALEHIVLPKIPQSDVILPNPPRNTNISRVFRFLITHFNNLKTIDMKRMSELSRGAGRLQELEAFLELCKACVTNHVKLLNVQAEWFWEARNVNPDQLIGLESPVVSIICADGLDLGFIQGMDMPMLEELELKSVVGCPNTNVSAARPNWPMLKNLKVPITGSLRSAPCRRMHALLQFFLEGDPYPKLEHLYLRLFCDSCVGVQFGQPLISNATLKKLTLERWEGPGLALANVCMGITGLNEVVLIEPANEINQTAFVFCASGIPVLVNLAKLKQLWFEDVEDSLPEKMINASGMSLPFSKLVSNVLLNLRNAKQPKTFKLVTCVGLRSLYATAFQEFAGKCSVEQCGLDGLAEETSWSIKMFVKMIHSALLLEK